MAKHIERKLREQENLRKSILQAALDIADAEGWERVTVRRIADAVEYTTSIVYSHFESKEALLQELVEMGFAAMYNLFKKSIENEPDPCRQLLALSSVNWDFAHKNAALYRLMFSNGRPVSHSIKQGSEMIDNIFMRLIGKNDAEIRVLRLNWLCLRQGAISRLMSDEPLEADKNKALFMEFIERFISSI